MAIKKKPPVTVNDDKLNQGRSDFFLPAELEELLEGNAPQPGDVLLLEATGASARLSHLAQRKSDYSHVGLVIGSDLYIDAVRKDGVSVRRISDMGDPKHKYVLAKCKVARNRKVVMQQVPVWPTAIKYYELPYRLYSVFMKAGGLEVEDDPVICSKLVAQIMADMGFELSKPTQRIMPKHLAEACRGADWEQFPLTDYDLFADPGGIPPERRRATKHWLDQVEPLHKQNQSLRKLLKQSAKRRK